MSLARVYRDHPTATPVELSPEQLDGVHALLVGQIAQHRLCSVGEMRSLFHRPIEAALDVMFRHCEVIEIQFADQSLFIAPPTPKGSLQ